VGANQKEMFELLKEKLTNVLKLRMRRGEGNFCQDTDTSDIEAETVQSVPFWSTVCYTDRPFGLAVDQVDTGTSDSARTLVGIYRTVSV